MNNLLLLPILIPLVTAIILIFFPKHVLWQRAVSALATMSLVVASSALLYRVHTDGIQTLNVGNWPRHSVLRSCPIRCPLYSY